MASVAPALERSSDDDEEERGVPKEPILFKWSHFLLHLLLVSPFALLSYPFKPVSFYLISINLSRPPCQGEIHQSVNLQIAIDELRSENKLNLHLSFLPPCFFRKKISFYVYFKPVTETKRLSHDDVD